MLTLTLSRRKKEGVNVLLACGFECAARVFKSTSLIGMVAHWDPPSHDAAFSQTLACAFQRPAAATAAAAKARPPAFPPARNKQSK